MNKNISCMCILILSVVFMAVLSGDLYGFGDLGLSVERIQDIHVDRCHYCGRSFKGGSIHRNAEMVVMEKMKESLTERNIGFREDTKQGRYIHVLIYKYEERRGGNFAVERPASVGFHMHLMEGNTVYKTYQFDEYQQALSENLFNIGKFLKRGARWVTAEELIEEGITKGFDVLLQGLE